MIRLPTLLLSLLLITLLFPSCDNEWPEDDCSCHNEGGYIGGWDESNDTTISNKRDSVSGFDINLDNWGDTINHDIPVK